MAFQAQLFEQVVQTPAGGVLIQAQVRSFVEGDTGFVIASLQSRHPPLEQLDGFQLEVVGRVQNPITLGLTTTYLTLFGLCFAPKVAGVFTEAVTLGYHETRPEGPGQWSGLDERVDAIARNVAKQGPKMGAKLVSAAAQCIWPFK